MLRKIHTFTLIASALASPALAEERRVCGDVFVESEAKIDFTDAEKRLLCGDDNNNAWRNIPPNEASYFIKTFLQTRGYHQVETSITKERLHVVANKITIIKDVILSRADELGLEIRRYWPIFGRPLTPAALDELDKWLQQELGRLGYACPKLQIVGNPVTGIVTIDVVGDQQHDFPEITSDGIEGLVGGVERRYDAFAPGEPYDSMLLDLTSRRMIEDGIVLNTYFITTCPEKKSTIDITQSVNSGEPRLVTFGIGIDTEEFLITKASWKNSRMGSMGSSLEVTATASYRVQEAQAVFNWYYAPIVASHYLRSIYNYRRENERRYDTRTMSVSTGPAWNLDLGNVRAALWPNIAYDHVETVRGVGEPTSDFLWLTTSFSGESHEYEYYRGDPREGFEFSLSAGISRKAVGSNITANRYAVSGTKLWNLFDLSPPIWIIGVRGEAATIIPQDETDESILPPNYRYSLGGTQNLRGFGRNAIPAVDEGALTIGYAGLETRLSSILPFGIQPIVFADFGRVGEKPMTFDPTLFWSPGAGVHWRSPIGTFRVTLARGQIEGELADELGYLRQWQFYLSYGEQF